MALTGFGGFPDDPPAGHTAGLEGALEGTDSAVLSIFGDWGVGKKSGSEEFVQRGGSGVLLWGLWGSYNSAGLRK